VYFYIKEHLGRGIALLMSFFVAQSAYFSFGYFNKPMYGNAHKVSILLALVFTYVIVLILPHLKDKKIRDGFVLVFIINVIWTTLAGMGITNYYGFDYNRSVTASVLSLMFPVCLYYLKGRHKYILALLTFNAILWTKASAGLGGFIGASFAYTWMRVSKLWSMVALSIGVGISYLVYGKDLLEPSGRLWAWENLYLKQGLVALREKGWFGFGFGISPSYMNILQQKYNIRNGSEIFWWAHNDLLQMFLECGPIIVVYISILYLFYLLRAYKNSCVYSVMFLISYGVNSLTNFPHHHATGIICVIMGLLLVNEENKFKKEIL